MARDLGRLTWDSGWDREERRGKDQFALEGVARAWWGRGDLSIRSHTLIVL